MINTKRRWSKFDDGMWTRDSYTWQDFAIRCFMLYLNGTWSFILYWWWPSNEQEKLSDSTYLPVMCFHKCRMDISLHQFHINKAIQTLCKQIEHCGVVSIFDRKIAWCMLWVVIKGRYKVINLYLYVCMLGGQTFHYHCQLKSQYLVHIKNCGKMAR